MRQGGDKCTQKGFPLTVTDCCPRTLCVNPPQRRLRQLRKVAFRRRLAQAPAHGEQRRPGQGVPSPEGTGAGRWRQGADCNRGRRRCRKAASGVMQTGWGSQWGGGRPHLYCITLEASVLCFQGPEWTAGGRQSRPQVAPVGISVGAGSPGAGRQTRGGAVSWPWRGHPRALTDGVSGGGWWLLLRSVCYLIRGDRRPWRETGKTMNFISDVLRLRLWRDAQEQVA